MWEFFLGVCKKGQNSLSFTLHILSVRKTRKLKYTKLKMNLTDSIFISVEIVMILSFLIMLLQ